MSKIVILAEKPSQGKTYAQALGGFSQKDGYLENDKYIITWAFGHLIELAKDDTYRPKGKWDKSYLPIIPGYENFQYIVKDDSGIKKQLKVIETAFKNGSEIYCATDSDREGELIFRYIYNYLNCQLPFKRVWISSLEDKEIRKAFFQPKFKQGDDFLENLSKSAYSRAIADWIIGVNGTQSATLQLGNGNLLSIGRVQSAILKIVCERFLKNKNHQKTYSYKIVSEHEYNGIKYTAESQIFDTTEKVGEIFRNLNSLHIFQSYNSKIEKISPPLLHTLDSLTIVANKIYKYNASQVLESAQKLYEAKLISYPRTEDAYITEEGYNKLRSFLIDLGNQFLDIQNFNFPHFIPKSVNASKITGSHDAIVPTGQTNGVKNLSEIDQKIYSLILHRCFESFSTEAVYEKGVYLFDNNQTPFKSYTSKVAEIGWKQFSPKHKENEKEDDEKEADNTSAVQLPYQFGDFIPIEHISIKEIESKPPPIYTPATLIADLSNLGKFLKEENPQLYKQLSTEIDLKNLQIGTKATRPEQIKLLIEKRKFISFEKNKYIPTELGMTFYEAIKDTEIVNVAETAKLEADLKKVFEGNLTPQAFYFNISNYTRKMVGDIFSKQPNQIKREERKIYGICPKCNQGNIIEGKKAYGCSNWKNGCDFTIWKEIASKKLTEKNIEDLVKNKKSNLIKNFKSKAGKNFDAYLFIDEDFKTKFEFNN